MAGDGIGFARDRSVSIACPGRPAPAASARETGAGPGRTGAVFGRGRPLRVALVANLRSPAEVKARQWYGRDLDICRALGCQVRVVCRTAELRPADLYLTWWAARSAPVVALARATGAKSVVVAGGTDSVRSCALVPGHPFFHDAKPAWVRALTRMAMAHASVVAAVSATAAEEAQALGARNVRVIPNCVDTELFRPARRAGAPPGGPLIVTVCNMDRHACALKGLEVSVDAFAALARGGSEARLAIIGTRGDGAAAILERARAAGVGGRVECPGGMPNTEVAGWFRRAAVFITASCYETFGVAAAEAMASGLPVVASRVAGLTEVAGDAGLLVDSRDPGEFAAALRLVLDNGELAASLGARGRARIERLYGIGIRRELLGQLIEDLFPEGGCASGR
jgi:glycosyltransferase involved in cell wall biosynthesis